MAPFETFVAHGYEFAFVVGGSRRLGKPFYPGGPYQVVFAVEHAVDVGLYAFIVDDREARGKVGVAFYAGKIVAFPYLGVACCVQQVAQLLFLYGIAVGSVLVVAALPVCEKQVEYRDWLHRLLFLSKQKYKIFRSPDCHNYLFLCAFFPEWLSFFPFRSSKAYPLRRGREVLYSSFFRWIRAFEPSLPSGWPEVESAVICTRLPKKLIFLSSAMVRCDSFSSTSKRENSGKMSIFPMATRPGTLRLTMSMRVLG